MPRSSPRPSSREESVVAWFYRVLRNAVIAYHRRHTTASRSLDAFAAELDKQVEPDADTHGVVCQCVRQLSETLKPEYAQALRRIEQRSWTGAEKSAQIHDT